jgi:hypothetical protein
MGSSHVSKPRALDISDLPFTASTHKLQGLPLKNATICKIRPCEETGHQYVPASSNVNFTVVKPLGFPVNTEIQNSRRYMKGAGIVVGIATVYGLDN